MDYTVPVEFESADGKKTTGEAQTQTWSRDERSKRALKSFGMCWGIALCCIPIPIIHFTLLPLLLITGPILAFFVYQQTGAVLGGGGNCPRCGKPFTIARKQIHWPLKDICGECFSEVLVRPTGDPREEKFSPKPKP